MKESDCLPCPMCGGHAQIKPGKQYKVMIQSWHDIEEERYQPCTVVCMDCGLNIVRAACNAEYGGVNGAAKQARIASVRAWNQRSNGVANNEFNLTH